MAGGSIEDVIGRKMDEAGVDLAAGEGEVAHGEGVDEEGGLRLLLGDVDLVIGGCVEDDFRILLREGVFDGGAIGDIDSRPRPAGHFVSTRFELPHQLDSKLARGSEHYGSSAHGKHKYNLSLVSVDTD